MKYRAIISDAWAVTRENKKLIWYFAFIPAILSTIFYIGYFTYQAGSFWQSPIFQNEVHESFIGLLVGEISSIFERNPGFAAFLIFLGALIFLANILIPVFSQGALIQLIARLRTGNQISMLQGISFGFNRFLQLLEYNLVIKTFSIFGIVTEASFAFRNLPEAMAFFGWIFLLFFLVALIFTLLFTYAEYYLVIDKKGVFESILASSKLVIMQWQHTLFMLFMMAIISARILINILVALLIPALILAPIAFFASFALQSVGAIVGAILGLIALYFTSYFVGVFHVFSTSVWTFTFLELSSQKEVDVRSSQSEE